jgi:hypothetical protein
LANVLAVTTSPVAQESQSRNEVAQAPLISVPLQAALVTVIAEIDVTFQELMINFQSDVNLTVSNQDVNVLIFACIILQTSVRVVTQVKSNQVTLLNVQSIVILKLQSVTAARVAITLVGDVQPVKYAGLYVSSHNLNKILPSNTRGFPIQVKIIVYFQYVIILQFQVVPIFHLLVSV